MMAAWLHENNGQGMIATNYSITLKRSNSIMNMAPKMAFAHLGIYVTDPELMTDFYTRVLGFTVTDRSDIQGASLVFLSRNPDEHHQILLVPGRAPASQSTVNQISFRVVSLAELRRVHALLLNEGVEEIRPTNHGNSWAVYFLDPEGNRIELFAQSTWYMPPVSTPLDLSLTDEEIHRLTDAMAQAAPGHMRRSEWYEQMRCRMTEEGTLEHKAAAC
jgi:catechol 2,3-dioxygenase-like lactoylglutathione lyase family enzyme